MDALNAARNAAMHGQLDRLDEVQAYATLALAEALTRLADTRTAAPRTFAQALHTAADALAKGLAHVETVRVSTLTDWLHAYANHEEGIL